MSDKNMSWKHGGMVSKFPQGGRCVLYQDERKHPSIPQENISVNLNCSN